VILYSIINWLSFEVNVLDRYILLFLLVQGLSFDITVILSYDKLVNGNSKMGTNIL